jgi:hypothetical protein
MKKASEAEIKPQTKELRLQATRQGEGVRVGVEGKGFLPQMALQQLR